MTGFGGGGYRQIKVKYNRAGEIKMYTKFSNFRLVRNKICTECKVFRMKYLNWFRTQPTC